MADDICEVISEYLVGSSAARLDIVPVFTPSASAITEAVAFTVATVLASSAVLSDVVRGNNSALVAEQASISEAVAHSTEFVVLLEQSGRLADRLHVTARDVAADVASITDAADVAYPPAVLADSATLADAALASLQGRELIADSAAFADGLAAVKSVALSEQGAADDAAIGFMRIVAELADDASLSESLVHSQRTGGLLPENGDFADAALPTISYRMVVAEEGVIEDAAYAGGGGAAWATPTDTFAMSRWSATPFNSIAEIDGALFVASESGLYQLVPGANEAVPIAASVRGGLTDFGGPALKHASYFYMGYQSPGTLRVTMGYIPQGVEESVTYQMPARVANDPVPGRTKLGRGMRSLYWRVSVENVDGADFTIHAQSMLVDGSSRRI